MQNVGWAALEVIPTVKGFEGRLTSQVNPHLATAGKKGGLIFGDEAGKSMSSRFTSHAKSAALLAGGILGGVAAVGVKFAKDSLQGYEDHLRVLGVTRSTIKATGGAANVTTRQVSKMTDALEAQTGVDGDLIQAGANMLLTFKNVRNEQGKNNDIFTQSLSILNDMSTAMGTDAKSSAIQLGKALNDPVKGISALSRVGVTFDAGQKKQIANYEKQGQLAKAQGIILKELQSEFGGAAKAQETMGDRVLVSYHALQDEVGKFLLPQVQDFEGFLSKKGIPTAEHLFRVFERQGVPQIKAFVRGSRPLVDSILPAAKTGFGDVAGFLHAAAGPATKVISAFNSLPDWAQKSIVLGAGTGLLAKKTGVLNFGKSALTASAGGGVLGIVSKSKPVPVFVVNNGIGTGPSDEGGFLGKWLKRALPTATTAEGGLALTAPEAAGMVGLFATGVTAETVLLRHQIKLAQGLARDRSISSLGHFNGPDNPKLARETADRFARDTILSNGPVWSAHLRAASTTVDALDAGLKATSRDLDLVAAKGGKSFQSLVQGGGEYRVLLSKLPRDVQTKILTPGLIETSRDVLELKRHYDLTPKQVRTVYKLEGIDRARRDFDALQAHMGRHQSFEQNIELAGRSPSQTALDGVRRR